MKRFLFCLCAAIFVLACDKAQEEITVESVSLNQPSAQMLVGESLQLEATVLPAEAVDKTISWSSSNKTVAMVEDGLVAALAEGEATITAKAGDKEAVCSISVISVSFKEVTTSNVTQFTFKVSGGISHAYGISILEQGFCWQEIDSEETGFVSSEGQAVISPVKANTKYKVWYYAKAVEGEFKSQDVSVATLPESSLFGAMEFANVTPTSFSVSGSIIVDGGLQIIKRGFSYGISGSVSDSDIEQEIEGDLGTFSATIANLQTNTYYEVRPFITNEAGTYYGVPVNQKTLSGIPSVSTYVLLNVEGSCLSLSTSIGETNGATVSRVFYRYGLNEEASSSDKQVEAQQENGSYYAEITPPYWGPVYYIHTYTETEYGQNKVFTCYYPSSNREGNNCSLPFHFENLNVGTIGLETAVINPPYVTYGGPHTSMYVSDVGVCYSSEHIPTVSDNRVNLRDAIFYNRPVELTGLTPSTRYFVRFYIKQYDIEGCDYSQPWEFTTASVQ